MDVPELPLSEAESMIRNFGDAANIGQTVRRWREEHLDAHGNSDPWSAEDLAVKIGSSQSTVARIENPKPGAAARVTIKVALDICRAFDKPLFELLVPSARGALLDGWSAFREAAEALNDMRDANRRYADLMRRVSVRLASSPELRMSIDSYLSESIAHRETKIGLIWDIDGGTKGDQPIFDKFAEPYRAPTPAIVAAQDALSGRSQDYNAWAHREERDQP